jgi:hypothetical protein
MYLKTIIMNTTIDTQKIEKLNQLKAEQERIENEIRAQERVAGNESKKLDAVKHAEAKLAKDVEGVTRLETIKAAIITQALKLGINLTVTRITKKLSVTPWTYIYSPAGQSLDEKWQGTDITEDVNVTELSYKDYNFTVASNGTIELPYRIVNSHRTYKLKTAVKKIDEYIATQNRQETDKQRKEIALRAAMSWLTNSIKQSGAKAEVTSKTTGSTGYDYSRSKRQQTWIEWNEITVQFENGNRLRYKVGYTANEKFTLNLVEFIDVRISDRKKDPILSINHLK